MQVSIKGITDTAPNGCCDHCGRADLVRYICLELADGTFGYFGSTCGPRVLKVKQSELDRAVRAFEAEEAESKYRAVRAAREAEDAAWFAWLLTNGSGPDNFTRIKSLGGFGKARAAYVAAQGGAQ